jgi:hypothetical protein
VASSAVTPYCIFGDFREHTPRFDMVVHEVVHSPSVPYCMAQSETPMKTATCRAGQRTRAGMSTLVARREVLSVRLAIFAPRRSGEMLELGQQGQR